MGGGAGLTTSLSDVRSAELYRRAAHVLPGGVNSPVRAMRSIGREPIFIERAEGAEITDVDGNTYVDYVCSWGPLILGHAHPDVVEAVTDAAARGTTFGAPTAGEVELAELVCARMPAVDMLRMTSSGTEATMSALRLARAATGREKVLKFAGAYHGHVDGLLADAGSGLATQGIPASPGVPEAAAAQTVVVPWNDQDALRKAFAEHELAAAICEPYAANMGLVPPRCGFLELLRELCTDTLLIFDEVITGFRIAPGGAQELTGVLPDLTVLGKVLGGGLPAAAYGGSEALMSRIAPAGDVYQAGTLSGNPLAVAAGRAALERLDEEAYLALSATTAALADGLREAAGDRAVSVVHTTGLLTVFFAPEPPPTTPARPPATARPTARGAARCWRAGSTRRRRSSRPGSPRSPTRPSTSRAPSRPRRRRSPKSGNRLAAIALRVASRTSRGLTYEFARLAREVREAAGCSPAPSRPPRRTATRRRGRGRPPRRRPRGRLRAAGRGDPRGLPPALRRAAAWCGPRTPICRCWRAIACTPSGSRGWPSWATSTRSPSWPT